MTTFQLFSKHKLIYKDAVNWRTTKRIPGQINALPHSVGILVATNGIVCLIEQEAGDKVYEGHLQFFVPDNDSDNDEVEAVKADHLKTRKPLTIDLEEYKNLLDF